MNGFNRPQNNPRNEFNAIAGIVLALGVGAILTGIPVFFGLLFVASAGVLWLIGRKGGRDAITWLAIVLLVAFGVDIGLMKLAENYVPWLHTILTWSPIG